MANTTYFFLLFCGFAAGYGVGSLIEQHNAAKMFEQIDHTAKQLFNGAIKEARNMARENEIEFDEEKFVMKISNRSGVKIEKIEDEE